MIRKQTHRILMLLILVSFLALAACSPQRRDYMTRIGMLDDGETEQIDEESIAELETIISSLVDEVEQVTSSTQELGTFYKMLSVDFFDAGMFGPALDYLEKALYIYPENHVLYYYAAVCRARIARTVSDLDRMQDDLIRAEEYYLEALRIRPTYRDALYGIGILYLFELNAPDRSLVYLERLAALAAERTDVRFVLARAYAELGEYGLAEEMYNEVIALDPDGDAAENARRLLDELGGEV